MNYTENFFRKRWGMCYPFSFDNNSAFDESYYDKLCENALMFYQDIGEKMNKVEKYLPGIKDHYFESFRKFFDLRGFTDVIIWDSLCFAVDEEIACFMTQIALSSELKTVARKEKSAIGQVLYGSPQETELGCFQCNKRCSLKKLKFY